MSDSVATGTTLSDAQQQNTNPQERARQAALARGSLTRGFTGPGDYSTQGGVVFHFNNQNQYNAYVDNVLPNQGNQAADLARYQTQTQYASNQGYNIPALQAGVQNDSRQQVVAGRASAFVKTTGTTEYASAHQEIDSAPPSSQQRQNGILAALSRPGGPLAPTPSYSSVFVSQPGRSSGLVPNFETASGATFAVGAPVYGVNLFDAENRGILAANIRKGLYTNAGDALGGKSRPSFTPQYGYSTPQGEVILEYAPVAASFGTPDTSAQDQLYERRTALDPYVMRAGVFLTEAGAEGKRYSLEASTFLPSNGTLLGSILPNREGVSIAGEQGFGTVQGLGDYLRHNPSGALADYFGAELVAVRVGGAVGIVTNRVATGEKVIYGTSGLQRATLLEKGIVAGGAGAVLLQSPEDRGRSIPGAAGFARGFSQGFQETAPSGVEFLNVKRSSMEVRSTDQGVQAYGQGTARVNVVQYGTSQGTREVPALLTLEARPLASKNEYLVDVKSFSSVDVNGKSYAASESYTGGLRLNERSSVMGLVSGDKRTVFLSQTDGVTNRGLEYVSPGKAAVPLGDVFGVKGRSATFGTNEAGVLEVQASGKSRTLVAPQAYATHRATGSPSVLSEELSIVARGGFIPGSRITRYSENTGVEFGSASAGVNQRFADRGFRILTRSGRYTPPSVEQSTGVSVLQSRKGEVLFQERVKPDEAVLKPSDYAREVSNPENVGLSGLPLRTVYRSSPATVFLPFRREARSSVSAPSYDRSAGLRPVIIHDQPLLSDTGRRQLQVKQPGQQVRVPQQRQQFQAGDSLPPRSPDFITDTGFSPSPPSGPGLAGPPSPDFLPGFGGGGGFGGGSRSSRAGVNKLQYSASLVAQVFHVKGSRRQAALGSATGLTVRPYISKK